MVPMIPEGPYPQELLYLHLGNEPIKTKIKTISNIVPIDIFYLPENFNIIFVFYLPV